MKKALFISALTFFISVLSYGQQHNDHCGTEAWNRYLMSKNSSFDLEKIKQSSEKPKHFPKANNPGVIPVVVHVIWRTQDQNISDAQIQSQIDVMNKDFSKTNWDTIKVPSVWKSRIGNANLKFALANRDELGNVTTGITRKKTTITDIANSSGDIHCTSSKGGVDPWDRDRYLNIWVCEIAGNIYGFSSFPGSPADCDGMAIDFDCFGTMGTAKDPTDRGRTVTHEFGHWLNLIHIWGDANCGTDLVNDTPEQEEPNYGCPFFPSTSCNNGPDGDMYMNFMDYTDDNCMHMFTNGQVSRMQNALSTFRPDLLISDGFNGFDKIRNQVAKAYPNPTSDVLQIDSPIRFESYSIRQLDGKLMLSNTISNLNFEIDLHSFENGIYVLELSSEKQTEHHRIIVQH